MKKLLFAILLNFTFLPWSNCQEKVPVLERAVSIKASNQPIHDVLAKISEQGEFVFSYSPEEIGSNDLVSLDIQNKSVRQSLSEVFGDKVKYKVRGKYLIIQKNPLYVHTDEQKNFVEGYITESSSGKRLGNATVYNSELMVSTVTDKYGYFKIELPPEQRGAQLKVSKRGYNDTLVIQPNSRSKFINMELLGVKNADSLLSLINLHQFTSQITKWILDNKLWINSLNIHDTLYRDFQLSFIPQVSTNKLFSGNSVVNYSFNILAGYNQEVRKFEVGGILNMVRDNARNQFAGTGNIIGKTAYGLQGAGIFNISKEIVGVQGAGIFNIANDSVTGAQIAGIWNETEGNVKGAQVAGTWNHSTGIIYGAQVAGTFNIASYLRGFQVGGTFNIVRHDAEQGQVGGIFNITEGKMKGAQVSGIFNQAGQIEGPQVAGIFNTSGNNKGPQVAGICNQANDMEGSQISGICNSARNISGVQVAGIANYSSETDGVQVSGILNKTGYLKGTQVGLINIADSCNGTAIGLLSIIKKGYHQLEFSADETFYYNAAFRTGMPHFYSILNFGHKPQGEEIALWTYGFGFGTSFRNGKKVKLNLELTSNAIGDKPLVDINDNFYRLYFGAEKSMFKKINIAAGLTFNALINRNNNFNVAPYSMSGSDDSNDYSSKFWVGAKVGLRLF